MAWLDDRIQHHPKLLDLSDRAFRVWINTLCYCSMHGTGGHLEAALKAHRVPKVVVRELVKAGVWDEEDDGFWVHDWQEHNEKRDQSREEKRAAARERQRKHREKRRLSRVTGRDSHTDVTRDKGSGVTRDTSVTSLAGAGAPRARDHDHDQGDQGPSSSVDVDDELLEELKALRPTPDQLAQWTAADPERLRACLTAAKTKSRNPAAYLDTLIANGSQPLDDTEPGHSDLPTVWERFLAGHAWDDTFDQEQILDELHRRRTNHPGQLTDQQALTAWKTAREQRYPTDEPEPSLSTSAAKPATVHHG